MNIKGPNIIINEVLWVCMDIYLENAPRSRLHFHFEFGANFSGLQINFLFNVDEVKRTNSCDKVMLWYLQNYLFVVKNMIRNIVLTMYLLPIS